MRLSSGAGGAGGRGGGAWTAESVSNLSGCPEPSQAARHWCLLLKKQTVGPLSLTSVVL